MRLMSGMLLALLASGAAAETPLSFGNLEVEVSGHVNLGVLHYRDGLTARTWVPVDNAHSSSRARVEAVLPGAAVEARARLEVEYRPLASDRVSIADGADRDWNFGRENLRLLEIGVESEGWGAAWIGQGDMASEDLIEDTDLSGTSVAAQAAVDEHAAAQAFRLPGGALSDIRIGDAFAAHDGLGRALRLRYDTPRWLGLRASLAYGQDRLVGRSRADLVDVALRYEAERGEAEWLAAIGIGWEDGERVLAGAVSALHGPTGLSLTLAAGERDGRYGWAKLGWQRDLVAAGRTALSVDHWRGSDEAEAGARSRSWGIGVVQEVEAWDAELWLAVRRYEHRDAVTYRPGRLVFAGVRVAF